MEIPAVASETKKHRACRCVLTLTTERELRSATLKQLKEEDIDTFHYAKADTAPLAFELDLKLCNPSNLASIAYQNHMLCDSSTIDAKNWGKDAFLDQNLVCVDVHGSSSESFKKYKFDLWFSISEDPRVELSDCRKGGIEGIKFSMEAGKPNPNPNRKSFVIAQNSEYRKALFKVEIMSDEVVDCHCEGVCNARSNSWTGLTNIVTLQRLK